MIKRIGYILAAAIIFIAGFWLSKSLFQQKQKEVTEANVTVLLEKVEKVFKLVTVEGSFSEIYDQNNTKNYTVFLPFPSVFSFPKTATVHVTGKVLVGYDMEGVTMTIDSTKKQVILNNLPTEAEILAIDHELSYKNLKDSYFNSFKPDDYTKLNANAKQFLKQKALESRLIDEAQAQSNQMLELVKYMTETAGWTLVYNDNNDIKPIEILLD